MDDVTHCPINKPGEKVQAHIVQANLEDNAYVSEMYVGNPPQLVKALFDTGSTNTWVLNSMVDLGGAVKERGRPLTPVNPADGGVRAAFGATGARHRVP